MRWRFGVIMLLLPFILSCGPGNAQEKKEKKVTVRTSSTKGGWLGVQIQDMTAERAKKMAAKVEEGALIVEVVDDSPAAKAGLKSDDIIVEFGGREIYDADDLTKSVQKNSPGTKLDVVIQRGGEKKTLSVTLAKRKADEAAELLALPEMPHRFSWHSSTSTQGLKMNELNPQLGEYFNAPGGKGLLVEEVEKGSDAEAAGFKAGDVILRVGNETVEDMDDFWDGFEDYSKGQKAEVEILRKGNRLTLSLEVKEEEVGARPLRHFYLPRGNFQFHFDQPDKEQFELQLEKMRDNLESMKTKIQDQVEKAVKTYKVALRRVTV